MTALEQTYTTSIDQVTSRRTGLGLRAHDPALAWPGYTLITPVYGGNTSYLIDMTGGDVHHWQVPWPPGLASSLTARGTLLYCGRVVESDQPYLGTMPFKGGVVAEVGWDGTVLWSVRHATHHHDATLLNNGNVILLGLEEVPADVRSRVQGGIDEGETMYVDTVVEMTTGGAIVWEWSGTDHLDPDIDIIGPGNMSRTEWTHANRVIELPDNDLLLSSRNTSTLIVIDRASGAVRQRIGSGTLAGQHDPSLLENGNILVFDNGFQRQHPAPPHSRVIELNPTSGEIVWAYHDPAPFEFFSALQSSAQRLLNGNTLICEGLAGRVFEVTRDGQVVWEYVNPHFVHSPAEPNGPPANRMFRARRYDPLAIEPLLTHSTEGYTR